MRVKKRGEFMQGKFEYDRFLEYIENDERQAMQYKSKYIPEYLYKYQPIGKANERKMRLNTLQREQLWASRVGFLNDPFEFKMLYAEQNIDNIKEFYDDVLDRNEVICLSGRWNDKLMWAHYASSHSGMCLKYEFVYGSKGQVFPVEYVKKRQNIAQELIEWIECKRQVIDNLENNQSMTPEQMRKMYMCQRMMCTKDWVWKYEKEYRVITRNHKDIEDNEFDNYKKEMGSLHLSEEFGLRLSEIYVGLNCTDENKRAIIGTAKKINGNRINANLEDGMHDKKRMYKVLKDMGNIVTVWEIYADKNLELKCRQIY